MSSAAVRNLEAWYDDRVAVCDDPQCGWKRRLWRRFRWRKAGIRLHEAWYCSPQCFERAAEKDFARLCRSAPENPAGHRIPLGLVLLSRGCLTNSQLRTALEAQRAAGTGRIGQWLEKLGYATERQVTAALALQWACPVLEDLKSDAAALRMVPLTLLESFKMLPVKFAAATRTLLVAFANGIDYRALYAIEGMLDCHTEACIVQTSQIDAALAQARGGARQPEIVFETMGEAAEMARITCGYGLKLGAERVRIAGFGSLLWAKLDGQKQSYDLFFRATLPTSRLTRST